MCCTRGWHIGFRSPDKNIFLQKHLVWNNLIYYYCRGDTTSEYPTLAIPASSPSFFLIQRSAWVARCSLGVLLFLCVLGLFHSGHIKHRLLMYVVNHIIGRIGEGTKRELSSLFVRKNVKNRNCRPGSFSRSEKPYCNQQEKPKGGVFMENIRAPCRGRKRCTASKAL